MALSIRLIPNTIFVNPFHFIWRLLLFCQELNSVLLSLFQLTPCISDLLNYGLIKSEQELKKILSGHSKKSL